MGDWRKEAVCVFDAISVSVSETAPCFHNYIKVWSPYFRFYWTPLLAQGICAVVHQSGSQPDTCTGTLSGWSSAVYGPKYNRGQSWWLYVASWGFSFLRGLQAWDSLSRWVFWRMFSLIKWIKWNGIYTYSNLHAGQMNPTSWTFIRVTFAFLWFLPFCRIHRKMCVSEYIWVPRRFCPPVCQLWSWWSWEHNEPVWVWCQTVCWRAGQCDQHWALSTIKMQQTTLPCKWKKNVFSLCP